MCAFCIILGWALITAIILFFLGLCIWSNILRDTVNPDSLYQAALDPKYKNKYANKTKDPIPRPFSLSRVQLGAWTVIISCSYIYLVLCNCCPMANVAINTTALILMGISAGTAVAAGAVDQSQSQDGADRHQDEPSGGFLADILSDKNGISIHRFQNVVWTIIAMCLYLCYLSVAACKLPDLDNTIIGLTGISATAYVGLKINENKPK